MSSKELKACPDYIEAVERHEDMSPDGYLRIIRDGDGDVCLGVFGGSPSGGVDQWADIEFCTIGNGGGKSPHTIQALIELMKAMWRDNNDVPMPEFDPFADTRSAPETKPCTKDNFAYPNKCECEACTRKPVNTIPDELVESACEIAEYGCDYNGEFDSDRMREIIAHIAEYYAHEEQATCGCGDTYLDGSEGFYSIKLLGRCPNCEAADSHSQQQSKAETVQECIDAIRGCPNYYREQGNMSVFEVLAVFNALQAIKAKYEGEKG